MTQRLIEQRHCDHPCDDYLSGNPCKCAPCQLDHSDLGANFNGFGECVCCGYKATELRDSCI